MSEEPVTLVSLGNGAVVEAFDRELTRICENILDVNTEASTVREIRVTVRIRPDETRRKAVVTAQVTSKTGPVRGIGTEFGIGMKAGQATAVESNIQQLIFFDQDIPGRLRPVMLEQELQAIKDSVKTEIISIGGVPYVTRPVTDVRKADPEAKPINLNTLTEFVDFINKVPGPAQETFIVIQGPADVWLGGPMYGPFKQRGYFAHATVESLFKQSFQFGQYYDCETFIIALMTLFVASPGQQSVLALVGNITDENVQNHADDGVTQVVTARSGIATRQEVRVPILLQPFRTFREIEQPASLFILRMKQGEDGGKPKVALFEADGGAWKLDAIIGIRDYFVTKAITIPVLG